MGYNFPNAPATGATYTPSGGPTYTWDGIAWKSVQQGVPTTVFAGDSPPPSPALGMLWWESDTGQLFIWYNDGDSSQWVQISGGAPQNAPVDGGEYVMCNGAWRLSRQGFDITGLATLAIPVPAWLPETLRLTAWAVGSTGTSNQQLHVSADGTTFITTNTYGIGGFIHSSNGGTFGNSAWSAIGNVLMNTGADNPSIPQESEVLLKLNRRTAGEYLGFSSIGRAFNTTSHKQHAMWSGHASTDIPAGGSIKAVRWSLTGGTAVFGRVTVEWLP